MKKSQAPKEQFKQNRRCFSHGLKILGDYWTLTIISSLKAGEKRFCEIQRHLGELNPVTLTNRLKKLEKEKLVRRREETVDKLSVTYSLTKRGYAILPIIKEIEYFASKHL